MRRYLIRSAIALFVLSWLLLFSYFLRDFQSALFAFGPDEVARRVTAPDSSKTALLERALDFDLNFRLYIVQSPSTPNPNDRRQALWVSPDYEPTTQRNWNEELEWSKDATVIAVSIDGQYVFAYDFTSAQRVEDGVRIKQLLSARGLQTLLPARER
jgi:hypothetical protein